MAARLCVIDAAFCAAGKEEKKRWSRRRSRPEENRWLESACWPDSSLTQSPARTKNQSRKQKKSKHAIEKTNTKTITAQPIQRHSHTSNSFFAGCSRSQNCEPAQESREKRAFLYNTFWYKVCCHGPLKAHKERISRLLNF